MKTWKQNGMAIIAIIALAFTFIACDDGNGNKDTPEEPKDQTATISNLFGGDYTATVKGYLTDTEWNGVAGKIETLLNNSYNAAPTGPMGAAYKGRYTVVFTDEVTITVIKNPSYSKYQVVDGVFRKLNLNYSALDNLTNEDIANAILAMRDGVPIVE